jgi:transposase
MTDSAETLRARLAWVKYYEHCRDAGLTCLRCGICRPTLRKWWNRYQERGQAGLVSKSRRRHTLPEPKVKQADINTLLELRRTRKLGPKGIQTELQRLYNVHFSTATIWTILARHVGPSWRLCVRTLPPKAAHSQTLQSSCARRPGSDR